MASQENLSRIYPLKITPGRFGNHFNERQKPDALGKTPATPLEIQRAINGEFNHPPQQPVTNPRRRNESVISEWELLKQVREQGKKEARLRRSCGNDAPKIKNHKK